MPRLKLQVSAELCVQRLAIARESQRNDKFVFLRRVIYNAHPTPTTSLIVSAPRRRFPLRECSEGGYPAGAGWWQRLTF